MKDTNPHSRQSTSDLTDFLILLADLHLNQIPNLMSYKSTPSKSPEQTKISKGPFSLPQGERDKLTTYPTNPIPAPKPTMYEQIQKNSLSNQIKDVSNVNPLSTTLMAGVVDGVTKISDKEYREQKTSELLDAIMEDNEEKQSKLLETLQKDKNNPLKVPEKIATSFKERLRWFPFSNNFFRKDKV